MAEMTWSGNRPVVGCSVLEDIWGRCLRSEDGFEEAFKGRLALGAEALTGAEMHKQYVTFRMLVHLMVYMKACPDAVSDGFPDGKNERDLGYQKWMELSGTSVGLPERFTGSHESPVAHWRTWHFRSYPRKQDGTKRVGVVFVNAAVVGMEMKDPVTVEVVVGKVKEG
jgi:hypothetical protein